MAQSAGLHIESDQGEHLSLIKFCINLAGLPLLTSTKCFVQSNFTIENVVNMTLNIKQRYLLFCGVLQITFFAQTIILDGCAMEVTLCLTHCDAVTETQVIKY